MNGTSQEWRDFLKRPGAIATVTDPAWLVEGCPKCDHPDKTWEVTNDGWAYCKGCSWGTSISFHITRFMATLSPCPTNGWKVEENERSWP